MFRVDIRRTSDPQHVAKVALQKGREWDKVELDTDDWLQRMMACTRDSKHFKGENLVLRDGAVVNDGRPAVTADFRQDFATVAGQCRAAIKGPTIFVGKHQDVERKVLKWEIPNVVRVQDRTGSTKDLYVKNSPSEPKEGDRKDVVLSSAFATADPRVFVAEEVHHERIPYVKAILQCVADTKNTWGAQFGVKMNYFWNYTVSLELQSDKDGSVPLSLPKAHRDALLPVLERCVAATPMQRYGLFGTKTVSEYNPKATTMCGATPVMSVIE